MRKVCNYIIPPHWPCNVKIRKRKCLGPIEGNYGKHKMILHICNYNMESMEAEEEREEKAYELPSISLNQPLKVKSLHTSQPFDSHSHSNYLQIKLNYNNPRRLNRSRRSEEIQIDQPFLRMASANREMAVYCFDTLVAHYNSQQPPPPAFDEAQQYSP